MQHETNDGPLFTPVEARVMACLMEKQLATPNNYPLTINSLTLACNQKSSREPVMELTEGEVGHTVNTLADRGFVSIEFGDRAKKVFHKARGKLRLDVKQQAVLCVLMLRAPQTLTDIRVRTGRMAEFSGTEEIAAILEDFMTRTPPLAVCFPAGAGRREARYAHTLCGEVALPEADPVADEPRGSAARLEALEQRVAELEARLGALERTRGGGSGG